METLRMRSVVTVTEADVTEHVLCAAARLVSSLGGTLTSFVLFGRRGTEGLNNWPKDPQQAIEPGCESVTSALNPAPLLPCLSVLATVLHAFLAFFLALLLPPKHSFSLGLI